MSTKRKTLEEFVRDARKVHGDKYDYSLIKEYKNRKTKVEIICNACGLKFFQEPSNHLSGEGCPACGRKRTADSYRGKARLDSRRKVIGVGINDYGSSVINEDKKIINSYTRWRNILIRCYSKRYKNLKPSYNECHVCDEWLVFSNFKKWYDEHYVEGYQIDKDILIKGNKVYSPQTCCFVPPQVNGLLINRKRGRGKYPIGVSRKGSHYTSSVSVGNGETIYTGWFTSCEEAFNKYKEIKEAYIKKVAQEYFDNGMITEEVYAALMKYEVEITD